MNSGDLEKYSSAMTLSDMEIFVKLSWMQRAARFACSPFLFGGAGDG